MQAHYDLHLYSYSERTDYVLHVLHQRSATDPTAKRHYNGVLQWRFTVGSMVARYIYLSIQYFKRVTYLATIASTPCVPQ